MPENEFEKKVSSQMHDLKLKPSDKVWLQVEERIRRKKKKRFFIIFFLVGALALLGYWQWDNLIAERKNEMVVTAEPASEKKDDTHELATKNDKTNKVPHKDTNGDKKETNNPNSISVVEKKDQNLKETVIKTDNQLRKKNSVDASHKNTVVKNERNVNHVRNDSEPEPPQSNKKNELVVRDAEIAMLEKSKSTEQDSGKTKHNDNSEPNQLSDQKESKASENRIDSTTDKIANKKGAFRKDSLFIRSDSMSKNILLNDSPVVRLPVKKPEKKWRLGLEFTPGISSLNKHLFSFGETKRDDLVFSSPSTGTGSNVSFPPAQPSASRSGFAFQIGGFLKKQMTHRSSLSVGLRYGLYRDRIRIGSDTLVNYSSAQSFVTLRSFYRASSSFREKTNNYHFIEIPVNYYLRLNKNKDKPLTWHTGFALSRLIATDAVMYDTAFRGVYYKNEKWLNKTQFSFTTGLSLTIMNTKHTQWAIGPAIDIHVNSLVHSPFEDKKYLFFAGLRSSVVFKPKQ